VERVPCREGGENGSPSFFYTRSLEPRSPPLPDASTVPSLPSREPLFREGCHGASGVPDRLCSFHFCFYLLFFFLFFFSFFFSFFLQVFLFSSLSLLSLPPYSPLDDTMPPLIFSKIGSLHENPHRSHEKKEKIKKMKTKNETKKSKSQIDVGRNKMKRKEGKSKSDVISCEKHRTRKQF